MLLLTAIFFVAFLATASAQLYACPPTVDFNSTIFNNWKGVDVIGKWHQCDYFHQNPDGTGASIYCFYYTATRGIARFPDTPIRADSNPNCPLTLPLAGNYLIKSSTAGIGAGNCLGTSGMDGAPVIVTACDYRHGNTDQIWAFDGNVIRHGTQCMDITEGVNADGTKVQVWTCAGNDNQNFVHSGGQILSIPDDRISWLTYPDKCLDLPNGDETAGNQIQIWTCYSDNDNQLWYLEPVV